MFRPPCWYVRRVSFAPLADTHLQSLIDLAGSEKATSDKERTREGKYINTRSVPHHYFPVKRATADRVDLHRRKAYSRWEA